MIKSDEPFLSNYINSVGVKNGIPVSGTFELTRRCNFRCAMCYVHSEENHENELSADDWLKIAGEARDRGMIFLLLTGGEPFLRDDFTQIYSSLAEMGFVISVNTNGSLYRDGVRDLLLKYPPMRLNVSLYGLTDETCASLCGVRTCGTVAGSIRQMKTDGQRVRINYSPVTANVGEMELVAGFVRSIGVPVRFAPYVFPHTRSSMNDDARLSPERAAEAAAKWRKINGFSVPEDDADDECAIKGRNVVCRAGRSAFWITWDGRMLPCGTMNVEGFSLRNMPFSEAWERTVDFTGAVLLPEECSECGMRGRCPVCASACLAETGRFDGRPEYLCRMTGAAGGKGNNED